MSFEEDLAKFSVKLERMTPQLLPTVASELYASIVDGSQVTGSPGQPVDTGTLRNSWQVRFPSPDVAEITTGVEYAPFVEDNIKGVQFRNHGPHSVALTLAGAQKIVDRVAEDLAK